MSAALPPSISPLPWAPPELVDPPQRVGWVCARCRVDAHRNEVLGISFCPIHGLSSALVPIAPSRRTYPSGVL